jgi:hydroxylaminobenzene mutase
MQTKPSPVSTILARQGHRLLQIGVALFLFTSFEGFVIPYFAVPNLGRSVHTLSAFSGNLLLALGLLWPRLDLGEGRVERVAARITFWSLLYSDLAIVLAFLLAGVWGAGHSIIPLAAGSAHGSELQEAVITVVAYSAAPPGLTSFALILWGLRSAPLASQGAR